MLYIYYCVCVRISSLRPFHLPPPATYTYTHTKTQTHNVHTVIIKLRACILYDRARVRRRKKK